MKAKILVYLLPVLVLPAIHLAQAQQAEKVPRIGYLSGSPHSSITERIEGFRQGLRELGYMEGKNIVIEWRSAEGKRDRLPALATELVHLKVEVIVTGWPVSNPFRQKSNVHDSYCSDARSQSGPRRVRCQPGTAGR